MAGINHDGNQGIMPHDAVHVRGEHLRGQEGEANDMFRALLFFLLLAPRLKSHGETELPPRVLSPRISRQANLRLHIVTHHLRSSAPEDAACGTEARIQRCSSAPERPKARVFVA